jgi:hypothetical protein
MLLCARRKLEFLEYSKLIYDISAEDGVGAGSRARARNARSLDCAELRETGNSTSLGMTKRAKSGFEPAFGVFERVEDFDVSLRPENSVHAGGVVLDCSAHHKGALGLQRKGINHVR